MSNQICFDSAVNLKENNYPQPEFKTGQFWYNTNKNHPRFRFEGFLFVFGENIKSKAFMFVENFLFEYNDIPKTYQTTKVHEIQNFTYAPSIEELLRDLKYENVSLNFCEKENKYRVNWRTISNFTENPIELLVDIWLKKPKTLEVVIKENTKEEIKDAFWELQIFCPEFDRNKECYLDEISLRHYQRTIESQEILVFDFKSFEFNGFDVCLIIKLERTITRKTKFYQNG
jgi:hypothetical protein